VHHARACRAVVLCSHIVHVVMARPPRTAQRGRPVEFTPMARPRWRYRPPSPITRVELSHPTNAGVHWKIAEAAQGSPLEGWAGTRFMQTRKEQHPHFRLSSPPAARPCSPANDYSYPIVPYHAATYVSVQLIYTAHGERQVGVKRPNVYNPI